MIKKKKKKKCREREKYIYNKNDWSQSKDYAVWVNPFVSIETNIDTFANSADPDETARNEPSQLDLNCLPIR